ncbi:MAG: hypothetical protein U9R23_01440 [Candidatus Cloacimonadota bacterium]|nr:hypothetical protein [Candidatus Cloacimonadota bacterium]
MTDTREKLFAAKYFLERMKEEIADRDAFKYNLSAFLAAARSVTLIMQKEFDKISGFKEWYAEKQSKMRNDETMRLLNDKRVMTIHQEPVRPRAHINVGISEHVTISDSISIVITRADGTVERRESEPTPPPAPAKTEATTEWLWYFDELPKKDVVTLCEEHVVKLETLLADCESRFAS